MMVKRKTCFSSVFFKGLSAGFCLSMAWSLWTGLSNPLSAGTSASHVEIVAE